MGKLVIPRTDSFSSLDEEEQCWVCLCGRDEGDDLIHPCKCPSRWVHRKCLARWQLHSAGKDEEKHCRFCSQELPDWRPVLTPANLSLTVPVVSVHYNGMCYRLKVKPGPEGLEHFRRSLQKITGMPALEAMQITFQCRAPDSAAQELSFKGLSAFEAAIHCASVSAAARQELRPSSSSNGCDGAQVHHQPSSSRANPCALPSHQSAPVPAASDSASSTDSDIFEEHSPAATPTSAQPASSVARWPDVPLMGTPAGSDDDHSSRMVHPHEQWQALSQVRRSSAPTTTFRGLLHRLFS